MPSEARAMGMKRVIDDGVNGEPAEGWVEWSRAGWARHLPGVTDEFVAGLGEGTIHGLAHATANTSADRLALRIGSAWVRPGAVAILANSSYTKPELVQLAAAANPALTITEDDEAWLAGKAQPWTQLGEPDSP